MLRDSGCKRAVQFAQPVLQNIGEGSLGVTGVLPHHPRHDSMHVAERPQHAGHGIVGVDFVLK
jgi:hypothetical protein